MFIVDIDNYHHCYFHAMKDEAKEVLVCVVQNVFYLE